MELKDYQQEVLDDLSSFIEHLDKGESLNNAYCNYWQSKGINVNSLINNVLHPYDNSVKGVPRVMFKVPTAGGKTFIACNAIHTIFNHFPQNKPKVVAWFVPSDPILEQTYKNLSNPSHPYRQKLNALFNNAVMVVNKESALNGIGIRPNQIGEQLTIFVLSVQSFASNNKDGRRVYRENSNLAEYIDVFGKDNLIKDADETSFIQLLANLNPVVIIDESHNFEANLRLEMLNSINPCFILDLTATPRDKSNIISFVDAMKLKNANMVKLPVILYNRDSVNDVIIDAIHLQRNLESKAIEMERNGGAYIRPIVLFQAQPKSDKDTITFDKIKTQLIEAGISQEHIKIKTAEKNELKNVDLMSRECEVRYIITINALKEGWDCPFAYILASLANKTSKIDVEQILGRVLRLPYTTKHNVEFLNYSYVFTSSVNFRETVDGVIKSLNNEGFSSKDYRIAENSNNEQNINQKQTQIIQTSLFDGSQNVSNSNTESEINSDQIKNAVQSLNSDTVQHIEAMLLNASQQNTEYENVIKTTDFNGVIPNDLRDKVKTYNIRPVFEKEAKEIELPKFVKKVNEKSLFADSNDFVLLNRQMLAQDFNLERADCNVDFTIEDQDVIKIDLEQRNNDEYVPKQYNLTSSQFFNVKQLFANFNIDDKRKNLASKIANQLKFDEIHEPHITNFVNRVLQSQNEVQLCYLFENDNVAVRVIKKKIELLLLDYQKKKFNEFVNTGEIKCVPKYKFPQTLTLNQLSKNIANGLYIEEGEMNDFEYKVISKVASLPCVDFWHRNPERGVGFCINGFINHYPDFIVKLKSGHIVLIETKGDDRDNSDSKTKLNLGNMWANKAGDKYRYFMVFENAKLDDAISVSELIDWLQKISQTCPTL